MKGVSQGNIIDKVYNVYFTNYNMTNLLSLKRKINNIFLIQLKNSQPSGLYRGNCNSSYVDALYPLLICKELSNIAFKSSYDGNINNYSDAFNNLFGDIIECNDFMKKFDKKFITKNDKELVKKLYTIYKKRI